MPLRLPDFTNTSLRLLTACGELQIEDRSLAKWLASQKRLEARFRSSGRTGFVRVNATGRRPPQHLHIDLAAREFFRKKPPKPPNKLSEIKALIQRLFQQTIEVRARGVYAIPRDHLPEFIRSAVVETKAGEVSLRTSGGRLAVRGAPVHGLWWWLDEDDQTTWIELRARLKREINESYLVDIGQVLDSAFSALFPGR